jgi:hypothetical protein
MRELNGELSMRTFPTLPMLNIRSRIDRSRKAHTHISRLKCNFYGPIDTNLGATHNGKQEVNEGKLMRGTQ